MDPSETGESSTPLAEITNNINEGVLDRNERRRQRYASMPKEHKDELNRKRRERRLEKKGRTNENTICHGGTNQGNHSHSPTKGVSVTMDEDEENEWLHRGHLTQDNDLPVSTLHCLLNYCLPSILTLSHVCLLESFAIRFLLHSGKMPSCMAALANHFSCLVESEHTTITLIQPGAVLWIPILEAERDAVVRRRLEARRTRSPPEARPWPAAVRPGGRARGGHRRGGWRTGGDGDSRERGSRDRERETERIIGRKI